MSYSPRSFGEPFPERMGSRSGATLADVLERVLDTGIVIAGDITVNLLDIELLTLKIRLLIASVDTARSMGIDWWESDPFLTRRAGDLEQENRDLRRRLERLEELAPSQPSPEREKEDLRRRLERLEELAPSEPGPTQLRSSRSSTSETATQHRANVGPFDENGHRDPR